MVERIEQLEPRSVWSIFTELSRFPRGSGNEAAAQEFLERRAAARGWSTRRDAAGNLYIGVPASPGREGDPAVLLQGHVDMVCEKNAATTHDFTRDPIRLRRDGDWVRAEGTTLGADNGIGVAMALAAAEDPAVVHGPLDLLVTVDEERGLSGAKGVRPDWISARRMINLDSEEDHAIFFGCAGGRDSILELPAARGAVPAEWRWVRFSMTGLVGGHSGLDIHRNRGNAIKILARLLSVASEGIDMRLASFEGGSMRNAIPREASAVVAIPMEREQEFTLGLLGCLDAIRREEMAGIDDGLRLGMEAADAAESALTPGDSARLLRLIDALPSGVLAMSSDVEGLVQTSSNLGVVRTREDGFRIVCCSRSPLRASLDGVALQHRSIAGLAGAAIEQPPGYPGWKPNPQSELLAVVTSRYTEIFDRAPERKVVHAGLECGLLSEAIPGLDIVSFGPDVEGAHSPDERASIASVGRVWRLLVAVLASLR